jgi:hypothetical protein
MNAQKIIAAIVTLLVAGTAAFAQNVPPATHKLRIESLMSAEKFKACGLNKLSSEEIDHLNTWLMNFARNVKKVVKEKEATASHPGPNSPSVIEAEIDGDFNGWEGQTIFKLNNGQIWQQTEYAYEYEYAYNPEVTIYKTDGGYKMKVEGMDDTIYVRRIK